MSTQAVEIISLQRIGAENPFSHIHHAKKRAFLAAYAELGLVTRAARAAKCHRVSHMLWKRDDPEYAAAFKIAQDLAVQRLEDAAVQRGMYGIDRPVFHKGKICGYVREYSDVLLIFALKGALPEKYRERFEHSTKDGKPLLAIADVRRYLADAGDAE